MNNSFISSTLFHQLRVQFVVIVSCGLHHVPNVSRSHLNTAAYSRFGAFLTTILGAIKVENSGEGAFLLDFARSSSVGCLSGGPWWIHTPCFEIPGLVPSHIISYIRSFHLVK